jgi:ribosomal protein S18 acetylase RimI-like enzyme
VPHPQPHPAPDVPVAAPTAAVPAAAPTVAVPAAAPTVAVPAAAPTVGSRAAAPTVGSPAAAPTVSVREAAPAEHPAVAALLEEAFTATFTITDWYRENLRRVAEHARTSRVWVATADGVDGLVGAVLVPHETDVDPDGRPELGFRLLAVHPRARGLGVGRALVARAVAVARERGVARIGIRSGPQMVEAHGMYRALGFVRRPERETLVVDGGQRLLFFTYDVPPQPAQH